MTAYIPVPDPITPAWLTAVLRASGALWQGEVTAVESMATDAFNSQTSHLRLRCSADAPSDASVQLVLKRNIPAAWGVEAGAEEAKFYNLAASQREYAPAIVPCYAAAYDEASGNSYLLLRDLSPTHRPPITRDQQISVVEGVPPDAYIEAVVDTLARLHAYWWEHPWRHTEVFAVGDWARNAERFGQYLERRTTAWQSLIAAESAWFPEDLRALYEQALARLPSYRRQYLEPRLRTRTKLTLMHGDAYFCNFLCPRQPDAHPTYLLDWQSYSFDIGGNDLANLCATFWTPEQRHAEAREINILRRYHTTLQAHGVGDYAWDDLLLDYRLGLIYWLFVPVQDRYDGSSKDYWWPKMQCLTAAFREWGCENLLGMRVDGG